MKIKENMTSEYQEGYNKNLDPYGHAVYVYLERWANSMEDLINEGKSPEDVMKEDAEKLSHSSDISGITGFQYGCAVNILAHVWEYGEYLKAWHNAEYNYKGDGVVNPAILTLSPKGE